MLNWNLITVLSTGTTRGLLLRVDGQPLLFPMPAKGTHWECRGATVAEVPTYPRSREGERLKALRRERGLTWGQVAKALDLSAEQVNGLERGKYRLTRRQWELLLLEVGEMRAVKPPEEE